MGEIYIEMTQHPLDIFGVNEEKLNYIRKYFPELRVILRGNILKVIGNEEQLRDFEAKIKLIFFHFERFNKLSEKDIQSILDKGENMEQEENAPSLKNSEIILFGTNGRPVKALTENQHRLVQACLHKDMVFAIGPAGSGKTYTAVAMAVRALKNKEVKRVILTRPAVEAGENLGFLPGDMKEKLDPYMQPLYDALRDMIPYQKLLSFMEEGIIEIVPLAFMRGRTLDHAFVILDEAQNVSEGQMKMFLTRMGKSAKFVITGDVTQIDLPSKQISGLKYVEQILGHIHGIEFIHLKAEDVVRHKLVAQILEAYEKIDIAGR